MTNIENKEDGVKSKNLMPYKRNCECHPNSLNAIFTMCSMHLQV